MDPADPDTASAGNTIQKKAQKASDGFKSLLEKKSRTSAAASRGPDHAGSAYDPLDDSSSELERPLLSYPPADSSSFPDDERENVGDVLDERSGPPADADHDDDDSDDDDDAHDVNGGVLTGGGKKSPPEQEQRRHHEDQAPESRGRDLDERDSFVEQLNFFDRMGDRYLKWLPKWLKFWRRENWAFNCYFFGFPFAVAGAITFFYYGLKTDSNWMIDLAWLFFFCTGIALTIGLVVQKMDSISVDMVKNLSADKDAQATLVSIFTNQSIVSALMFTVLAQMIISDYNFDAVDDFITRSKVGKNFWKMLTFFNCYIAMVFCILGTLICVVLLIYITPLGSDAAVRFMIRVGWASGLAFEFTVCGIVWLFGAIFCTVRVQYGAAPFFGAVLGPILILYVLSYIWFEASAFKTKSRERHSSVLVLRNNKRATEEKVVSIWKSQTKKK